MSSVGRPLVKLVSARPASSGEQGAEQHAPYSASAALEAPRGCLGTPRIWGFNVTMFRGMPAHGAGFVVQLSASRRLHPQAACR